MKKALMLVLLFGIIPTIMFLNHPDTTVESAYDDNWVWYHDYLEAKVDGFEILPVWGDVTTEEIDLDQEGTDTFTSKDFWKPTWPTGNLANLGIGLVSIEFGVVGNWYYAYELDYSIVNSEIVWGSAVWNTDWSGIKYDYGEGVTGYIFQNSYLNENYVFEFTGYDGDYATWDVFTPDYGYQYFTDVRVSWIYEDLLIGNEQEITFYSNLFFGGRDFDIDNFFGTPSTGKSMGLTFNEDNTLIDHDGTDYSVIEFGKIVYDNFIDILPKINNDGSWSFGIVDTVIDMILEGADYLATQTVRLFDLIVDTVNDFITEIFDWWPWG